ncbi:MAG: hypothetical protein AAF697_12240 [Pseudomonadota bacterium]
MVNVLAWESSDRVLLTGHGLTLDADFELADGVRISPIVHELDEGGLASLEEIKDRAAIATMHEIASFSVEVIDDRGGKELATKGWNRLWDFHLLSLASHSPAFILYSASPSKAGMAYAVANRNLILSPLDNIHKLGSDELEWAKEHEPSFRKLISDETFSAAMRYFGNAHYLFDLEHRIMLLWAGIEGLLSVEAEHNHRIALYSAVLLHGSPDEKQSTFKAVKEAYSLRSRVVHGAKPSEAKLKKGYAQATNLLAGLLARSVELGAVPSRNDLDDAIMLAKFPS